MQFSVSHQDTKAVNFDIYSLLKRHGFGTIADKLKPDLQLMGKLLNEFFDRFGEAPIDDLMFIIGDDLSSVITDFGRDMDAFQREFAKKSPQVAAIVKVASGLFTQIGQAFKTTFSVLLVGQKRKGKPLYDKRLGQVEVKLSTNIGKLLTPEQSPKWLSVFVEFFGMLGRASNQAIQKSLDRVKVLGILPPQYIPIQLFGQTLDLLLNQIIGVFKDI
ncbi:uncharacterized protein LOC128953216 [Oppia nitens]|uniref:uncharacterized protein LOC128953216 n=1 Tax=Oppia nitens TaxID=1686743 RepID=UPI0023DA3F89|nr:uncharacterized protein LOC128953216 [Oppia nitens]